MEACAAAGLVVNGNEPSIVMTEAVGELECPAQLRFLFIQLLLEGANGLLV